MPHRGTILARWFWQREFGTRDAGTAGSLSFIDLKLDWHGEATSMCHDGPPDQTNRQWIAEKCTSCCPESLHSTSPIYRLIVYNLNPITSYRQNKIGEWETLYKKSHRERMLTFLPSCLLKLKLFYFLGDDGS